MNRSGRKVGNVATIGVVMVLFLCASDLTAQAASPNTPPPRFPQAAKFDPKTSPTSAAQHAAMVRIAAGLYTIGSPNDHCTCEQGRRCLRTRITIGAFKIDRTEVTNAQFAEFMNALPVKPTGTALGGKSGRRTSPPADHTIIPRVFEPTLPLHNDRPR